MFLVAAAGRFVEVRGGTRKEVSVMKALPAAAVRPQPHEILGPLLPVAVPSPPSRNLPATRAYPGMPDPTRL